MEMRSRVYVQALEDVPDERFRMAVGEALRTCRFYPTPAELLQFAGTGTSARNIALEARASEALDALLDAASRGELPDMRRHPDAAARHAFAVVGRHAFEWCEPGRDETFRRKRWLEAYVSAAEQEAAERRLGIAPDRALAAAVVARLAGGGQ